ncbi:MAG: efflux RND transporter periplasmic adaptor subunit [Gammaproteobacteria bacterium]|nr:efflux RND transporter periplasmic adaptor subunit [Gammaproteobacteria bacterium]
MWLQCLLQPHTRVELSFPASGVVESVVVDRGDRVAAGQELARLESSMEEAAVEQANLQAAAEGDLLARQANLRFATRYMERIRELYDGHNLSITDKEQAETDLILAHMELKRAQEAQAAAQVNLQQAKAALARRRLKSPVSGVVVNRYVSAGEYITNTPVLGVAQLDPLSVEVAVPAALFGNISPGMFVQLVTGWSPDTGARTARVVTVDPLIDRDTVTFGVRLELPNPGHELPGGLPCQVRFHTEQIARKTANESSGPGKQSSHLGRDPAEELTGRRDGARYGRDGSAMEFSGSGAGDQSVAPLEVVVVDDERSPGSTKTAQVALGSAVVQAETGEGKRDLVTPGIEEPVRGCAMVGPFSSTQQAGQARRALGLDGTRALIRRAKEREPDGFSVFASEQPSREAQQALLATLKKRRITDFVVLPTGHYAGRVALGHFQERSRAEIHRDSLAKKGIASEIEARFRNRYGHWLEISPIPPAPEVSRWVDRVQADWPGLGLKWRDCTLEQQFMGRESLADS